jgi:chromosome segregation ATPase
LRDQKQEAEVPPELQQQMQQQGEQIQQLSQALEAAAGHAEELEAKQDEIEVKRIEANTKAYDAITKRLSVLGPLLNPIEVQQLAAETQREAMEQPDPGQPPAESMGVPEQFPELMEYQEAPQEQQPAESGFFTPENAQ